MQGRMNQQMVPPADKSFFSESNQVQLFRIIASDFQQRTGGLSEKQQERLGKTIQHYMKEVWDFNGPEPLPKLNREVLVAATKDFTGYLRRDSDMPSLATSERIVGDVSNQPRLDQAQQQRLAIQNGSANALPVYPRPTFESNLLMDTGSRFEQMQQERIPPTAIRPTIPDFTTAFQMNGEDVPALTLFESAKKAREDEAARLVKTTPPTPPVPAPQLAPTDVNPLVRFMSPPSIQNDPQANPTLAQPIAQIIPSVRGPLPQDYLIKQDDIINYKETEYNLVIYSADRDWLNNSRENRYNFTVNFDPGNTKQGFYPSPTSIKKFKNISRIELVKAIVPAEGLDVVVQRTPNYDSDAKLSALQFPYVSIRIPELDTNNYGTDNFIDNAFAVVQYDANWYSDNTNLADVGYYAMIPKFMKCQKVYQPTPLATLTKLSITLQQPNGLPLSDTKDSVSITSIYDSKTVPAGVYAGDYATAVDSSATTNGTYYIIQTSTFFSRWAFNAGNTLQIKGIDPTQINTYSTVSAAANDFAAWLNRDEGHVICGIANTTVTDDGSNAVGYANLIIIRNQFRDPTTGSINVLPFGSATSNTALATALYNTGTTATTTFTGAACINLSQQTNLVLRIITRELDPAARVRPDNL